MRRVRQGSWIGRTVAIRPRVRLDLLILLTPYWESRRVDPEEKRAPRATSNTVAVESLKVLDPKPPNREEPILDAKRGSRLEANRQSSLLWSAVGWVHREPSLFVLQGAFTLINLLGIYRWAAL